MQIRFIIAVISFFATFGISSTLTKLLIGTNAPQSSFVYSENNRSAHRKIVNLLRQDIANGERRFRRLPANGLAETSKHAVYTQVVNQYVNDSESIDDSDLPQDFQAAWRDHMSAWRTHAEYLQKIQDFAAENEFNLTDRRVLRKYRKQNDEISRTWYKALRIARSYGDLPSDIY